MESTAPWWGGLMRYAVRIGEGGVRVECSAWTPTMNQILESFFLRIEDPAGKRRHRVARLREGLVLIELTRDPIDLLVLASCRLDMGQQGIPEVDEYFARIVRSMHNRFTSEEYAELLRRIPECIREQVPHSH